MNDVNDNDVDTSDETNVVEMQHGSSNQNVRVLTSNAMFTYFF